MSLYPSNLYEEKLDNRYSMCMTAAPISISIFIRICTFIQIYPGS
jgi:hypothetical protein